MNKSNLQPNLFPVLFRFYDRMQSSFLNTVSVSILSLILAFFLISTLSCKDDEMDYKEEGPIQLEGIWEIHPSATHAKLDFNTKSGYATLITDTNIEGFLSRETSEFILLSDGKGVRIQGESETVPTGYFLFQDRKKEVWLGLWKEELVRLVQIKTN